MRTARGPATGRPCSVVRKGVSERSPWGRASEEGRSTRRANKNQLLTWSCSLGGFVTRLGRDGCDELPRTRRERRKQSLRFTVWRVQCSPRKGCPGIASEV